MEQEEITKIYETLAPMAGDYANAQAEQIGQAQRSMGPMGAAVQGTTTSGLGNYTYNRLMRPQVDVMRDEIRTQGYANQLNRLLSDALNNARNNYNRRSRGGGGGGDGTTGGDPDSSIWDGEIEKENLTRQENTDDYQLFTVVGPQYPNGIQWKYTAGSGGGVFDNPTASYDNIHGAFELKRLVDSGHQIYNSNGDNITSRFK